MSSIESDQSIEFQSYQGLQRVVRGNIGIYEPLNKLIDWLRQIQYRSIDPISEGVKIESYEYQRSVRLLDTFLIGSMKEDTLRKLVHDSIEYKFPIQVLILDPYSPLAQLRANKLNSKTTNNQPTRNQAVDSRELNLSNAIGKVNQSLFSLLNTTREEISLEDLSIQGIEIPEVADNRSIDFLERQLDIIQKLKKRNFIDLEVRFYKEQTEVPVYLISRFVAKGLVFPNFQASKNPWLIFVDDRTQQNDIYDNFSKAFDDIWMNESSEYPNQLLSEKPSSSNDFILSQEASKRVFIVHGRDIGAKDSVARFVQDLKLEPISLAEQTSQGKTVIEKIEEFDDVGYAIILLTPDDMGYLKDTPEEVKSRARQNVVLELGYFMGKLSRNRICALSKGDVEIPSDYRGVLGVTMDSRGAWKVELAREMKSAGLEIDLNNLRS